MKIIQGGVTAPKGYLAAGVHANLRRNKTKKDMAMLVSENAAIVSGAFTQNSVKAAPVIWDRELCRTTGKAKALIVNSGVANACTGAAGYRNVEETADYAARLLKTDAKQIAVCSTGVIGMQLPMEKIRNGIDMLYAMTATTMEAGTAAAEAIMTTDLYKKEIAVTIDIDGTEVTLGGMCKGSGMINPNLGTVLAFITTDAVISKEILDEIILDDVKDTFNMVSVDGDTSTNDSVLIFANGMAGNSPINSHDENYGKFKAAINYINTYFARQIAADGEGATRMFQVDIKGAPNKESARRLAKSIVTSNLTKCAIYGADANWGRFVCAMGQSGVEFSPDKVDISIDSEKGSLFIAKAGLACDYDEDYATLVLSPKEVRLTANLNIGDERASAWGCDLTYDYIRINADYRK